MNSFATVFFPLLIKTLMITSIKVHIIHTMCVLLNRNVHIYLYLVRVHNYFPFCSNCEGIQAPRLFHCVMLHPDTKC